MPQDSSQSPIAKRYLIGAVVIGLVQVIDAGILFKNEGAVESASLALSVVEFFWVIVSIFVLFRTRHGGTRFVAFCFVAYNVCGWILGALMDVSETVPVPTWFVVFGGAFGMAYAIASAFVAKSGAGSQGAA